MHNTAGVTRNLLQIHFFGSQETADSSLDEEDSLETQDDEEETENDAERVVEKSEECKQHDGPEEVQQGGELEQPFFLPQQPDDSALSAKRNPGRPPQKKSGQDRAAAAAAEAETKTAARQRAELRQRIEKAVATVCRLCNDILLAGRATAAFFRGRSQRPHEEAAEQERSARRSREFDARLARGLYQVRHCCLLLSSFGTVCWPARSLAELLTG